MQLLVSSRIATLTLKVVEIFQDNGDMEGSMKSN